MNTNITQFIGESDLGQLGKIFNTLGNSYPINFYLIYGNNNGPIVNDFNDNVIKGTPTEQSWPGVSTLPNYVEFESRDPLDLSPIFGCVMEIFR